MASSDISEIKIIIRGLLVSSPREINVAKLRHDFKTQEGRDIPFYEYGYHDITSFLRSIPDVCQISHNESGPYAMVGLVESDKSAHVSSLVMRQKITTTKCRRRHSSLALRGKFSHVSYKPSAISHSFRSIKKLSHKPVRCELTSREHSQISYSIPNSGKPFVYAPAEFSENDPSCSLHNGYISVEENQTAGNNVENKEVFDESYSYVPDTRGNEYTELPAFINFHLRQLLTDNKGVHLDEVTQHLRDSLTMYGIDCSKNTDNVVQILKTIPSIKIENGYVYLYHSLHEEQSDELTNHVETDKTSHKVVDDLVDNNTRNNDKGDLRATADIFVPSGSNEKIQRLERNLFSLMKDHPSGILGSELKEKYKMKFAAPLNFQILGCGNAWELACSMPHIFNSIFLEDGNFKLYPAYLTNGQKLKSLKSPLLPEGQSTKKHFIPALTKRNVQWLMQGYPNGLCAKDFEQTYKDTFLGDIELTEMGFSQMKEFLHCLEKLDVLQIHRTEFDTWLLPSPDSVNLAVDETPLPLQENMENEIDIRAFKEKFPGDVVGPDTHVIQVEIPSDLKKGSEQIVFVQEVNNPHHFWITLHGENNHSALNSLMDDLQAFYCTKSHSYKMAPELIREGQDCVTQFIDEWHRARVTRIVSANEVEVCFYDYGTRRVVPKDNVHYLLTAHSALPAQAVRAALANIAPVGEKWTQEASKRFLQLIADKALFAIIKTVDKVNKVFSLFLCDTRGKEDIYIHEVLVSEGFAILILNETKEKDFQNGAKTYVDTTESTQFEWKTNEESTFHRSDDTLTYVTEGHVKKHAAPDSDPCQEVHAYNLRTSPLPCALKRNEITCAPSSFASSTCAPASTSTSCVSRTSELPSSGNSASPLQQVAPPPGFRESSKCKAKTEDNERASPTFKNNSVCEESKETKEAVEVPKHCTEDSIVDMDEIHELHSRKSSDVPGHENFDYRTAKGVSSGVNANFPQEIRSPYVPNVNTYPTWMAAPTYSQFSGFPSSFAPLNINTALSPLTMAPFPLPPLPNPMDFYSLWYFEHCRQQALLQAGILAHQQMAASTLPPLPPGLYLPHSQNTLNTHLLSSQNCQMNISEVPSPEPSPSVPSNSRPDSASSVTTQTEVLSLCESTQVQTYPTNKTTNVSSYAKFSTLVPAADVSVQTCVDDTLPLENLSTRDTQKDSVLLQINKDESDSLSQETFTVSDKVLCEGEASNDAVSGTCMLPFSAGLSLDNVRESEAKINLPNASSANSELNKLDVEPCVLQFSPATQSSEDVHRSQNITKDEEHKEETVSINSLTFDSHNSQDLDVESNDADCVKEISGRQDICDKRSEESEMVLNSDINVHSQNKCESKKTTEIVNRSVNDADQCFTKRSQEMEAGEPDCDQKVSFSSLTENIEREMTEESACGQTLELMENVQQESLKAVTHSEAFRESSENLPVSPVVHTQYGSFPSGIGRIIRNLNTKSIIDSAPESSGSSKVQKDSEIKQNDTKGAFNESGIVAGQLGKDERLMTDLSFSFDKSDTSPLAPNGVAFEEGFQNSLSTSNSLCSDFKALTVSNLDSSDKILQQSKQRKSRILPPVSKTSLQTSSKDMESSTSMLKNLEKSNTVLERKTVSQTYHNVQEVEEKFEVPSKSCAFNLQNIVRAKKKASATDTTSSIPTTPPKKGQPFLGGKVLSGVSDTISSLSPCTLIQKSQGLISSEIALQPKDDRLSSEPSYVNWKQTWCSEENGRHGVQKEISHDFTKSSSVGSVVRNLPKQTNTFWHKESQQSAKQDTSQQFVKKIYLRSRKVHQINLDGRPYVLTDEIVSYFTPFNGRHVILKILEARKVEINFLELSRRRRPEFFECLDKSDIECISRGPTGNIIGSVHIVPLRSVPYMLRALNRDDAALSSEVKEEMEKFDPNDSFWSGHYN